MTKKVAYFGLFTSLALILSYIEALIPIQVMFPVYGVKLGLANSMTLVTLYLTTPQTSLAIAVCRILLSGFMFGNMGAIIYSMAGGLFSFLMMYLVKRFAGFSLLGVSVVGSVAHVSAQLFVAGLVLHSFQAILVYLPPDFVSSVIFGILIGIITREIMKRLPKEIFREIRRS